MRLRGKFLISIGLVLLVSFGVTFYRTAQFQNKLVLDSAERQARMLSQQIVLTRKWVADHNGLFFFKGPGVEANPFLDAPIIKDLTGRDLVLRNPAMVTRELAQYSSKSDLFTFRVTSLNPVNPLNKPDEFEKKGLAQLERGAKEVVGVEQQGGERVLRFMSPLIVEESCLKCHESQGYKMGGVRGGLSLIVPLSWADTSIRKNNWFLLMIAVVSFLVVGATIYLLLDAIVVKRIALLSLAMGEFPAKKPQLELLPKGEDEVGILSLKFSELADRLICSNQELAETKESMFQSEKMASLGRLSAGIAHEVNNPLGGMRNCVKSMKESPADNQLALRYLDLLDKGLVRVENTMRQLLNFGRKEPLRQRLVLVDELIRECCELIRYRLKNIEISYELSLKEVFLIDVESFRQSIVNVLINAIDAMPEGGRLSISTASQSSGIVIMICDTGLGIPSENIRKIFDPFFTTKDIGKGTGLGLSVTYALVEKMRGVIEVESREGEGSCFRITLPNEASNRETKQKLPSVIEKE